jgi:hypothetical protein
VNNDASSVDDGTGSGLSNILNGLPHGFGHFRRCWRSAALPDLLAGALKLLAHQVNHPFPAVGGDYLGQGIGSQHTIYAGQIAELHLSLTIHSQGPQNGLYFTTKE